MWLISEINDKTSIYRVRSVLGKLIQGVNTGLSIHKPGGKKC